MHRNPYKELCTGRRLVKSSIYNSALLGKQLLILAEADIADRNVHVYALVPKDHAWYSAVVVNAAWGSLCIVLRYISLQIPCCTCSD